MTVRRHTANDRYADMRLICCVETTTTSPVSHLASRQLTPTQGSESRLTSEPSQYGFLPESVATNAVSYTIS